MATRSEGLGENVSPANVIPPSNNPNTTTGKVIFWSGTFFVGIAALAVGGLLIPHLASFAFEFKIIALTSGILGGSLMIGGHVLQKRRLEKEWEGLVSQANEMQRQIDLTDPTKIKQRAFETAYIEGAIKVKIDLEEDDWFRRALPAEEGASRKVPLFYNREKRKCLIYNYGATDLRKRAYEFPDTIITKKDGKYYIKLAYHQDKDRWIDITKDGKRFWELEKEEKNNFYNLVPTLVQEITEILST